MSTVMKATPTHENRNDLADRYFDLDNAPVLEYTTDGGYRRPPKDVRWQPNRVTLHWSRGELIRARVFGLRLKKDGSVGMIKESVIFKIQGGIVQPLLSRQYPTKWVQSIVELFGEVPAFNERPESRELSYSRSQPCTLTEATIVV